MPTIRYKVELFQEDGTSRWEHYSWGYQAHRAGRQDPKRFPWYTITRLRDKKVVSEMEYQDRIVTGSYWLNVTHSPVCMGGYWYNPIRPDKALRIPPPPRPCPKKPDPPKEPPVIYLMQTDAGIMPSGQYDNKPESELDRK